MKVFVMLLGEYGNMIKDSIKICCSIREIKF